MQIYSFIIKLVDKLLNSTATGATGTSNYDAGQLYAITTTDENGHTSIQYKDKEGHMVCKKVQSAINPVTSAPIYIATYYVYDDLGNLTYVIPPIPATTAYPTSFAETGDIFMNFIYGYHYDQRNRLTEKKIPGKGWEFIVYNTLDQPIYTQDAIQRSQSPQVWTFMKYDALGREVITGLWSSGTLAGSAADGNMVSPSRTLEQWLVSWAKGQTVLWVTRDNTTATGYTTANPTGKVLTINYYDDYTFTGQPKAFVTPDGASTMTTGLLTATKTTVLNTLTNAAPDMLWMVHHYDDLGRVTQTYAQHSLDT